MTKYYIVPIDQNDNAYFGVKSVMNPYSGVRYDYCGGCPNLFSGATNKEELLKLYIWKQEKNRTLKLISTRSLLGMVLASAVDFSNSCMFRGEMAFNR
jgi:hypothetical protein